MEDLIILAEDEKKSSQSLHTKDEKSQENAPSLYARLNELLYSFQKIKTKEKLLFYRLMATMLNAWMSIMKSLSVLEDQEKNPVFQRMLWEMLAGIKEGKTLSECMEVYAGSFSDAELWVIRAGEKTGRLNEVMISLADQVEKVSSVTGKLKAALIYPLMIMVVVTGVIFVMMTMVVPKLLEIFDDASELPATTQFLIGASNIFVNYWHFILIFLFLLYFAVIFWKKTPSWKYNFDLILLKLPVFWGVVQKVTLSKFSRVFAGLMGSGVSVVESLRIVADAVWNEVYRQRILLLLEDVRRGMKIWESLEGDPLFPNIMIQMVQVGEQSAKLDMTITKVADFYDDQVDTLASTMNKLLEPFIIIFLAVVVGFIAMAIMQPIMNLADSVTNS